MKRMFAAAVAGMAICTAAAYEYEPTATGGLRSVVSYVTNATGDRATIYVTHTFTDTDGTHVLTFNKAATADILVVGGGGGGARAATNPVGGGGGGVVYSQGVSLAAGTYSVTVGAGGIGGTGNINATPGGASAIVFDGADIARGNDTRTKHLSGAL